MTEILISGAIAGLLIFVFLATLIVGIVKKRRTLIFFSIASLFVAFCFGAWTTYLVINKSYQKVSSAFRPRTGEEIYRALLGSSQSNCVKVLHSRDQVIPRIDAAIYLHFEACPEELTRILSLRHYKTEKTATNNWYADDSLTNGDWYRPEVLGDTILVFTYEKDTVGNYQTIYAKLDSTAAFLIDVAD